MIAKQCGSDSLDTGLRGRLPRSTSTNGGNQIKNPIKMMATFSRRVDVTAVALENKNTAEWHVAVYLPAVPVKTQERPRTSWSGVLLPHDSAHSTNMTLNFLEGTRTE